MSHQLKLGLTLFSLGLIGVLSLITISVPLGELPPQITEQVSPTALKLLTLLNPLVLLLIAVIIGTNLAATVRLGAPGIAAWLKGEAAPIPFRQQVKFGSLLGLLTGVLLALLGLAFRFSWAAEWAEIGGRVDLPVLVRLLYGGITEEILMRFGFMTLMVWIVFRLTKNLKPHIYWIGIFLSALLFGIGHFPIVYHAVPAPSFFLLAYVLVSNTLAGLFFGWLYWKKGLEAAFIGHIVAHLVMMTVEHFS